MRRLSSLTCLLALGVAAMPPAWAATASQTAAQLHELQEKINAVSRQVSHDAVERDRQSKTLRAAELSVGAARAALASVQQEQAERSKSRAALAQQRSAEQQSLDRERAGLAAQLRVAYMIGQTEPLKLLLNQQDPVHVSRMFTFYGYFGRARATQLDAIAQQVKHLDALDAELADQETHLQQLHLKQQERLEELEQHRSERAQVLASLQAEAHSREQSLTRLKNQQADLERLLKELTRVVRSAPPPDNGTAFGRLRGRLDWPVAGRVVAGFDSARAANVRWEGVVIATEQSAPVRAVAAGRVIYADWLPGLGRLVIVDHGEEYLSLYGYNDELHKAAGDLVAAGDVIAAAGDSGGRPEPELFFEIRRAGKPVDPQQWFRQPKPP
ncbi:MAG TPA: peptidoglycan DD-metalloendopeptidase family protein [Steroidobacteraceae bacterium]